MYHKVYEMKIRWVFRIFSLEWPTKNRKKPQPLLVTKIRIKWKRTVRASRGKIGIQILPIKEVLYVMISKTHQKRPK